MKGQNPGPVPTAPRRRRWPWLAAVVVVLGAAAAFSAHAGAPCPPDVPACRNEPNVPPHIREKLIREGKLPPDRGTAPPRSERRREWVEVEPGRPVEPVTPPPAVVTAPPAVIVGPPGCVVKRPDRWPDDMPYPCEYELRPPPPPGRVGDKCQNAAEPCETPVPGTLGLVCAALGAAWAMRRRACT